MCTRASPYPSTQLRQLFIIPSNHKRTICWANSPSPTDYNHLLWLYHLSRSAVRPLHRPQPLTLTLGCSPFFAVFCILSCYCCPTEYNDIDTWFPWISWQIQDTCQAKGISPIEDVRLCFLLVGVAFFIWRTLVHSINIWGLLARCHGRWCQRPRGRHHIRYRSRARVPSVSVPRASAAVTEVTGQQDVNVHHSITIIRTRLVV